MYEMPSFVPAMFWGGAAVAVAFIYWPVTLVLIALGIWFTVWYSRKRAAVEAERRRVIYAEVKRDRADPDASDAKVAMFRALASGERPSVAMLERRLGVSRKSASMLMAWAEEEEWISPSIYGRRRDLLLDEGKLRTYVEISDSLDQQAVGR